MNYLNYIKVSSTKISMIHFIMTILLFLNSLKLSAQNIYIDGTVTDNNSFSVPGAVVTFTINSKDYSALTKTDGSYLIRVSGLYPLEPELLEVESPFPNPFSNSVKIPVIISEDGDITFAVYDLAGRKMTELKFQSLIAGAYRITWDGSSQFGAPVAGGYYIYAVTFKGKTVSGRLVKTPGISMFSDPTGIEIFMPSDDPGIKPDGYRIPVTVRGKKDGYYDLRLTDISLTGDTTINLVMIPFMDRPFKVTVTNIAWNTGQEFQSLVLKGVNLGSSPPGYFPGEIAYSITPDMYERWIELMGQSGFNALRVYTLHPPVFYEKLAEYNYRHPSNPLFLFQGVWLDEMEDWSLPGEYDLLARSDAFKTSIREVIDCMHGNKNIPFRPGRAYGQYVTDISPWIAGYIIGREIMPQEVDSTNKFHAGTTSWSGSNFSISNGAPSEVFVTRMLDETVKYEWDNWGVKRTVSMSSWPTLDPLVHPTETRTDEDKASIDITKIIESDAEKSLFASYHAYAYYPDFVSDDPQYRTFSDDMGQNSYLGYLTALKDHYSDIPLVIAEFGVPSSWGSGHGSFSNMPHGGLSQEQQGTCNIRMLRNLLSAGCAGGFMFSWMDEWFKATWIVQYLEAYGTIIDDVNVPTRQLWHNLTSPEQNFGLIGFEETTAEQWWDYSLDGTDKPLTSAKASNDNSYFYLDLNLLSAPVSGDTIMIAFDTYLEDTGESVIPGGRTISNRSEFLMEAVKGNDSVSFYVTEAYDMYGLSPRFNLSDPLVQKFKSTVSNGADWKLMSWVNNGFSGAVFDIGRLPAEESTDFTQGSRTAVVWDNDRIHIRIPWTMLYFYDPTQMKVIDGAVSYDGGYSFEIISRQSDGIAVSVYAGAGITNSTTRYTWPAWLVVPRTNDKPKKSLEIISEGLSSIQGFVE
jgi:hypothetical protein